MIVRWKPDGTRTFVNAAYGHAFGSSQGELLGTSLFRFLADEDRERIRKKLASLTPDQPIATDVHRTFISDGETRLHAWPDRVLVDAQGRLTELQSVGRDITELNKAVEELTISEARYRTLIETAPEAIVVLEAETGKFVDFNENACHLFGLPGEELLKQTPVEVSPPQQLQAESFVHGRYSERTRTCPHYVPVWVFDGCRASSSARGIQQQNVARVERVGQTSVLLQVRTAGMPQEVRVQS